DLRGKAFPLASNADAFFGTPPSSGDTPQRLSPPPRKTSGEGRVIFVPRRRRAPSIFASDKRSIECGQALSDCIRRSSVWRNDRGAPVRHIKRGYCVRLIRAAA